MNHWRLDMLPFFHFLKFVRVKENRFKDKQMKKENILVQTKIFNRMIFPCERSQEKKKMYVFLSLDGDLDW